MEAGTILTQFKNLNSGAINERLKKTVEISTAAALAGGVFAYVYQKNVIAWGLISAITAGIVYQVIENKK